MFVRKLEGIGGKQSIWQTICNGLIDQLCRDLKKDNWGRGDALDSES